jgi:nucleoside-diphosphate-sugar epimerase
LVAAVAKGCPLNDDASRDHVLVTGGAGFVGSKVVELLAGSGRTIRVVDIVENQRLGDLSSLPGVDCDVADLRDRESLDRLLEGVSHVVHLAAVRSVSSDSNPRLSHEVNVDATYDLIAGAARHGVRRIIFGSSHTVYGAFQDPAGFPFRETETGGTGRGLSMYAATKLAAEAYLEAFLGAGGPEYLSLRFGTIYGPRVSEGSNNATMLDVLRALDAQAVPSVPWARDSRHGLVHVDDVAISCERALSCGPAGMAINVVGEPVSAQEIYSSLVRLYGGDADAIQWRDSRTRYQAADRSRMRQVLGLTDCVPLEQGLQTFIDWYRSET